MTGLTNTQRFALLGLGCGFFALSRYFSEPQHAEVRVEEHRSPEIKNTDKKREIDSTSSARVEYLLSITQAYTPRQEENPTTSLVGQSTEVKRIADRLKVRLLFHSVYKSLGLTESQIASFEDAASAKFNDINILALQPGSVPTDAENRHFITRLAQLEDVVKASLGEQALPAFTDFYAKADLHQIVDKVAVNSFYLGEAFFDPTSQKLIQTALKFANRDSTRFRLDPKEIDWPAVIDASAKYLTDKQLLALKTAIQVESYDWEVRKLTGNSRRILSRGL